MERTVREINRKKPQKPKRLRVAAYGRVSSDKETMLHSLSAQVEYYSRLIQSHSDWIYCGVYSDEGITGTKEERPGFQRLMTDCRAGKIDMVITKAVSRFARNTLTTLNAIRELKALGIDVFFEREKIHTIGTSGELLITIIASIAQDESRSASENRKWRIRHGFEQGELMTLNYLFGYTIRKGEIEINEQEAPVVREVFQRFIEGESITSLARDLERRGIGKPLDGHWSRGAVHELLTNEKYMGDALLQKTYVNNYLEKKKTENHGQLRQFYVKSSHPAIIDRETYAKAQVILNEKRQMTAGQAHMESTPFSHKIICGNCGYWYRRITVSGMKYYQCRTYMEKGKAVCAAKRIPENILYEESTTVLGLSCFDERVFKEQVDSITVFDGNRLVFAFHDGHSVERIWQDRSRATSWTQEMKDAARQAAIEQHRRERECRVER